MKISPGTEFRIKGKFKFRATVADNNEIEDYYQIEITIPNNYPRDLPIIKEVGRKIPRDGTFHVNPDESLCLGSPLRLLSIL